MTNPDVSRPERDPQSNLGRVVALAAGLIGVLVALIASTALVLDNQNPDNRA